jgi:hypothetical protein
MWESRGNITSMWVGQLKATNCTGMNEIHKERENYIPVLYTTNLLNILILYYFVINIILLF